MRFLILALAALALAGCSVTTSSGSYHRGAYDRAPRGDIVYDVAYGSSLEPALNREDLYEMSAAFSYAMALTEGTSRDWSSRRSNVRGTVIAGEAYLTNVDFARGRRLYAPVGLQTNDPLEPAQGDYEVTQNINVRLGPNTDAPIVNTLTEGTVLEAAGRVRGSEWLLMARGGVIVGYMYGPLMRQREGGDLLLAGGTARTPVYCRDYRQTLRLHDRSDAWSGTACRTPNGQWEVQTGSRGAAG